MKHQTNADCRQMYGNTYEIFCGSDSDMRESEVHHHDFYEICFCAGGRETHWVDGETVQMEAGDLLLLHPGQLHCMVTASEGERIVLWINCTYLAKLSGEDMDLCRCFEHREHSHQMLLCAADCGGYQASERLSALLRESHSDSFGAPLLANGIFLQFMVEINRLVLRCAGGGSEAPGRITASENAALISRAIRYIGAHCSEELSPESVAQALEVSRNRLSHAFGREVGISLYRYITQRRLLLSRRLLADGAAAGEVCRLVGFGDYAGFFRAFRAEYGISPRAYADSIGNRSVPHGASDNH